LLHWDTVDFARIAPPAATRFVPLGSSYPNSEITPCSHSIGFIVIDHENTKSEYRNPKQIQIPKALMTQTWIKKLSRGHV